ncbi:selenocysteine-specific translation elongation factor [Phycicoccus sp. M110.8]|uniref:selenocysteine-specific translation elongation factor n=1 Tax=Phycicoccus sp. M110.8 TaxID=3075433 RepID=UPI0028FD4593|nr:selenocysteine-specific translation elongation factor [Phycicoccus sp. M110.8]MDU0314412.1 selenocysteine-specific translation elongation factor [Phycicoccus sp. M110.8]
MHVLATAGHVDHGKSTLVRALTGIEPDRWAEEHRRGLTIDLGYAWTTLPSGEEVAFVDVPGHERFIGNMLAGLGPAPAVVFVVAADEGWRTQSAEHLAAVDALGLSHGLLVVTRSDLADPRPALADAGERLARTSLGRVPAVAVSARTGEGLDALREQLDALVGRLPTPDPAARVRLWVDRAFSIKGAGTVVTGTLEQGTLRVGDEVEVGGRRLRIRGLQSLGRPRDAVGAVARVAVNLRDVAPDDVPRGTAVLTPGAWHPTTTLDVRTSSDPTELPGTVTLHLGTVAVEARLRPLAGDTARLTLPHPLALVAGDRAILREPGGHRLLVGALVLDADPPALRRRGDGRRRGEALAAHASVPDVATEVTRRGAMRRSHAAALGLDPATTHPDVVVEGDWLLDRSGLSGWATALAEAVRARAQAEALDPSLPVEAARAQAGIPDAALVPLVAATAGLEVRSGRVWLPGVAGSLGEAEEGLRAIEARLQEDPFAAPERPELEAAGLGPRQLAAAQRLGRVLRLPDDVVLLPSGPAQAMRLLAALPQPFTASDARRALGTTRRVVIPLLEHLDGRGWTRRVDGTLREVVRR